MEEVKIAIRKGGPVAISLDARDALLARLHPMPDAQHLIGCFHASGTSSQVELSDADRGLLHRVIDEWSRDTPGSLPNGLWALRSAIAHE